MRISVIGDIPFPLFARDEGNQNRQQEQQNKRKLSSVHEQKLVVLGAVYARSSRTNMARPTCRGGCINIHPRISPELQGAKTLPPRRNLSAAVKISVPPLTT